MAFKSFNQYQEEKRGDFFVLADDGDSADVVFLYRSANDVLVADVHWLSTTTYKGYVHCCEKGCPACNYVLPNGRRGIDKRTNMFIPLFNIQRNKIEFWDRSAKFEPVLQKAVFKSYPDPSACVFRITRRGAAGDPATRYEIAPIGRNTSMPYDKILADFNMTLPEGYSTICKEMSIADMDAALNSNAPSNLDDYGYVPVPRGTTIPDPIADVPTPEYSAPPTEVPPIPDYVPGSDPLPEYTETNSDFEGMPEPAESEDPIDNVQF